jgi:lipopolysaccharide/colanic/teichoic acid biosynthesis glycosyltransferase
MNESAPATPAPDLNGAAIAEPAQPGVRLERRSDMQRRVRFECDMNAVPLPLEVSPATYATTVKRWFDAVVAAIALILLSPLLLVIALAIKWHDRGPVFFIQNRTGYLGRRFRLYKFRTMLVNAEALKQELLADNIHGEDSPDFKLRDDPRVTRLGRFLRRTSLDELPNLINVVRGEMALVGPRPTSFDATTYAMHHLPRLAVRPGLTGLWQTSGRANLDFDERSDLDISYIRRMSLRFDIKLLLRTIRAVKKGDGAM